MTEYQVWIISITVVAAIVGCLSIMAACYSIRDNRRIARQKTTLDFIDSYNSNSRVDEAHRIIHKYKETPVKAISPLKNQNRIQGADRFLVSYEYVRIDGHWIDARYLRCPNDQRRFRRRFASDLCGCPKRQSHRCRARRDAGPAGFSESNTKNSFVLNLPSANRAAAAIRSPIHAKPRAPNLGDR